VRYPQGEFEAGEQSDTSSKGFLQKPFEREAFLERLRTLLEQAVSG